MHTPDHSNAEELVYRVRQQKLTTDFGTFALGTHDIATLLQEASRACAEGLRSELCKIMKYDTVRGDFLIVAGVGWHPNVVGHARIGGDLESPAGYAFDSGQPVVTNALATEQRFRTPALLIEHNVQRAVNVIIRIDGEAFGVLEVDSSNAGPSNGADADFLQGFANLLGAAIGRLHIDEVLRQKEALLKRSVEHEHMLALEIHHRVKNSLALVIGMLDMSRRSSGNSEVVQVLDEARNRVFAIADVHDHLARHGSGQRVPLDDFIGDLCKRLAEAHPSPTLVWNIPSIEASADRAIALGLIVNELVANAVKYAYSDLTGEVRVLIKIANDSAVLEVSDNGAGLPVGGKLKGGLGTRIIESLARQLGGAVEWHQNNPGTQVTLTFATEQPGASHV